MRYRFTFRRIPKSDVVVIQPQLQLAILEALRGVSFLRFDTQDRCISLRPKFVFLLLRNLRRSSRLAAWLASTVQVAEARVVLGMDNFDLSQHTKDDLTLYAEIGKLLKKSQVLSIQHGQELRRQILKQSESSVTLLCWGKWTAENFPNFGRHEARFVPVGALVDGLYRRERPDHIVKDVDICFVSTVKGESWWGPKIGERRAGYEELVQYLRKFQDRNNIRTLVAPTINRDQNRLQNEVEIERRWFLERLGSGITFSEPSTLFGVREPLSGDAREPRYLHERYSTYYSCDRASITLGMSSSVLWESFGRGNKVLAVNLTDNPIYDFPIPGIWAMRQPTYTQFEERLRLLLSMSDELWNQQSQYARVRLVAYDPTCPPHIAINREIMRALRSAHTDPNL